MEQDPFELQIIRPEPPEPPAPPAPAASSAPSPAKPAPSPLGTHPTDRDPAFKDILDFLYPPMPGKFSTYRIRRQSLEWLKDRYLDVFAASLGNHSVALYYCCWTRAKFNEVLDADPEFAERIDEARERLADRAAFIMHRGMGLIAERTMGGADLSPTPPNVSAAMAKLVEKMTEKAQAASSTTRRAKGRRLVIDGLDRTKTGAPPTEKRAP